MLQVPFIRDNQKLVLEGLAKRNFVNAKEIIANVLEADETRRNIQALLDNSLAESNKISKEIGILFKTGQVQKATLAKEKSKKLKEHKQMLTELKVGDEISTAGGLLGKIIKVGESYIQLKISDNVDIKLQKSSVNKILPKNSLESIK